MKYYAHDCSAFDDEKISELFIAFGYEGLGLFYTILEKLGKQEKPIKTEVLKVQLKVGKRLEKCWLFMEQIGIISSSNGETFNENILNNSEKYLIKKEKNREKISQWRERHMVTKNVTSYETVTKPVRNHHKDNISKDNISKVVEMPSQDSEFLTFNIEEYLLKNEEQFNLVCAGVYKKKDEVIPILKKYHLWNQENDKYPKKPLQLIAGLQKWILTEKKENNGTNFRNTPGNSKSAGANEVAERLAAKLAARGTENT